MASIAETKALLEQSLRRKTENERDVYDAGYNVGYDTANRVNAYGGDLKISYHGYRESIADRSFYESGWEAGVEAFSADYEEYLT